MKVLFLLLALAPGRQDPPLDGPTREVLERLWRALDDDDPARRRTARGELEKFVVDDARAAWVRAALPGASAEARAVGKALLDEYEGRKGPRLVFIEGPLGSGIGPGPEENQVCVVRPDGTGRRALTRGKGLRWGPSPSPDGRRVAFTRENQVWVVETTGNGERALTSGKEEKSWAKFTPDGKRVVYLAGPYREQRIRIVDLDGSNDRALSAGPDDAGVSFLPDGRMLFTREDDQSSVIWIMDADGRGARPLSTDRKGYRAAPSPDGRHAVYVHWMGDSDESFLKAIDLRDGSSRRLTRGEGVTERDPVFLGPDRILYLHSPSGSGEEDRKARRIVKLSLDGREREDFLSNDDIRGGHAHSLQVSPDGRWLLYQTGGPYVMGMTVVDVATRTARSLGEGSHAAWARGQ